MLAYMPNMDPMGHAYAHDGIEMDDAILKVWTDPLFWDKPARVNIKYGRFINSDLMSEYFMGTSHVSVILRNQWSHFQAVRQAHRLEKVPTFGASLPHVGQANDLPRPGLRCVCVRAQVEMGYTMVYGITGWKNVCSYFWKFGFWNMILIDFEALDFGK